MTWYRLMNNILIATICLFQEAHFYVVTLVKIDYFFPILNTIFSLYFFPTKKLFFSKTYFNAITYFITILNLEESTCRKTLQGRKIFWYSFHPTNHLKALNKSSFINLQLNEAKHNERDDKWFLEFPREMRERGSVVILEMCEA